MPTLEIQRVLEAILTKLDSMEEAIRAIQSGSPSAANPAGPVPVPNAEQLLGKLKIDYSLPNRVKGRWRGTCFKGVSQLQGKSGEQSSFELKGQPAEILRSVLEVGQGEGRLWDWLWGYIVFATLARKPVHELTPRELLDTMIPLCCRVRIEVATTWYKEILGLFGQVDCKHPQELARYAVIDLKKEDLADCCNVKDIWQFCAEALAAFDQSTTVLKDVDALSDSDKVAREAEALTCADKAATAALAAAKIDPLSFPANAVLILTSNQDIRTSDGSAGLPSNPREFCESQLRRFASSWEAMVEAAEGQLDPAPDPWDFGCDRVSILRATASLQHRYSSLRALAALLAPAAAPPAPAAAPPVPAAGMPAQVTGSLAPTAETPTQVEAPITPEKLQEKIDFLHECRRKLADNGKSQEFYEELRTKISEAEKDLGIQAVTSFGYAWESILDGLDELVGQNKTFIDNGALKRALEKCLRESRRAARGCYTGPPLARSRRS